jgi:hypothetical protein
MRNPGPIRSVVLEKTLCPQCRLIPVCPKRHVHIQISSLKLDKDLNVVV